MTGQIYRLSV